jgi:hypothetical protein
LCAPCGWETPFEEFAVTFTAKRIVPPESFGAFIATSTQSEKLLRHSNQILELTRAIHSYTTSQPEGTRSDNS